jgi:Formin Homology 2 Domain
VRGVKSAHTVTDLTSTALKQIKNSTKLVKVLEIVLAIGNRMNGGSARGLCTHSSLIDLQLLLPAMCSSLSLSLSPTL